MKIELADGVMELYRRIDVGEECIEVAAGHALEDDDPDRETFASDAISDILTAMFGPVGSYDQDGSEYRPNGDALTQAETLLKHALNSYAGDAEDYTHGDEL